MTRLVDPQGAVVGAGSSFRAFMRRIASSRTLAATVLVPYLALGVAQNSSHNPFDFYQFWLVGQAISTMPVGNIYGEADRRAVNDEFRKRADRTDVQIRKNAASTRDILDPTATPTFYAVFSLVSTGDFERDYLLFRVLSYLLYTGSIVALGCLLRLNPWAIILFVGFYTRVYWPFSTDTAFGNAGQVQMGMLSVVILLLQRESLRTDILAGGLLGFLLVFKPTIAFVPALLALYLVVQQRHRKLAALGGSAMAAALLCAAVPMALFGASCTWPAWRTAFPAMMFTDTFLAGGFLGKLFGLKDVQVYALFGLLLLGLVGVVLAQVARNTRLSHLPDEPSDPWYTIVALGVGIYILSGPIVHSHYFVLLVPLGLLTMRPGRRPWWYAVAAVAMMLTGGHGLLWHMGLTQGANHSLWTYLGVTIQMLLALAAITTKIGAAKSPPLRAGLEVST